MGFNLYVIWQSETKQKYATNNQEMMFFSLGGEGSSETGNSGNFYKNVM
jgi:hypothetical protein